MSTTWARLREHIFEAAASLPRTEPESAVTLRSVARRAGVAAPSICLRCPDRDALMLAVARAASSALEESLGHDGGEGNGVATPRHCAGSPTTTSPSPVSSRVATGSCLGLALTHLRRETSTVGWLPDGQDTTAADRRAARVLGLVRMVALTVIPPLIGQAFGGLGAPALRRSGARRRSPPIVRTYRPHDPSADVAQLSGLGPGQRFEDQPVDEVDVPRGGLTDLLDPAGGQGGQGVATILRVGRASHPVLDLQSRHRAGKARQRAVRVADSGPRHRRGRHPDVGSYRLHR